MENVTVVRDLHEYLGITEVFSVTSADHLVLELREDEHGFDDVADGRRADADVLDGAPPLGQSWLASA
jgi:hypothetical protein